MLGITLGFNLMEEAGYLARISFLFDRTMSKVGLQGKAIMPFFMGLGCTIAGTTGTRVVDNWGQRVLAIAMSWAVPCAATLSVVPTIAIALFGSTGGFLVMVSIFLFMFLMMWVIYRVFGKSLAPKEERVGLIIELPPYHKPAVRNILYVTFQRTLDIFLRALRVISLVSIVFFALAYGFGGSAENSMLYKIGVVIEPVTKFWRTEMAGVFGFLRFGHLQGVPAGRSQYPLRYRRKSGQRHIRSQGFRCGGQQYFRNPVCQLHQGGGAGVHLRHQLQYALRQRSGSHIKGDPFGEVDGENRRVLYPCGPAHRLYRVSCWIACVLKCRCGNASPVMPL